MHMHPHHLNIFGPIVDFLAVAVIAGSMAQVIPASASILAVVWYCIQIWESDTVKRWTNRTIEPPDNDESGEV